MARTDTDQTARKEQLNRVYVRDQAVCWICKTRIPRKRASRDHMDVACRSHNHKDHNIRLACISCNGKREDNDLTETERFEHESYLRFLRGLGLVKGRKLEPTFVGG